MKWKILFAMLGVAAFILGASTVIMAAQEDMDRPIKNYGFKVEIGGAESTSFTEIKGVGMQIDFTEYTSGDDNIIRSIPGAGRANLVTFIGPLTRDRSIEDWVRSVYEGEDIRKDISIVIMDPQKDVVRSIDLFGCYPTSYELPSIDSDTDEEVLTFELTVKVNRIEIS